MDASGARRVAFVTGASRGIGRTAALELGRAGFDVVVAARTRQEGEGRDDSDTSRGELALPGSVEGTARDVRATGVQALPIVLDMGDRAAIERAVHDVEERWDRIDVVVNNAVQLEGNLARVLDLSPELLEQALRVNAVNPLFLAQRCLPGMLARGSGVIIDITSMASLRDPPAPAGSGGWGVSYGMTKAALNRVAGVIAVEFADRGIRAYTLSVGAITERATLTRRLANLSDEGPSPAVPAAAIAWLAIGSDEAVVRNGELLFDHELVEQYGLALSDWAPAG